MGEKSFMRWFAIIGSGYVVLIMILLLGLATFDAWGDARKLLRLVFMAPMFILPVAWFSYAAWRVWDKNSGWL